MAEAEQKRLEAEAAAAEAAEGIARGEEEEAVRLAAELEQTKRGRALTARKTKGKKK